MAAQATTLTKREAIVSSLSRLPPEELGGRDVAALSDEALEELWLERQAALKEWSARQADAAKILDARVAALLDGDEETVRGALEDLDFELGAAAERHRTPSVLALLQPARRRLLNAAKMVQNGFRLSEFGRARPVARSVPPSEYPRGTPRRGRDPPATAAPFEDRRAAQASSTRRRTSTTR